MKALFYILFFYFLLSCKEPQKKELLVITEKKPLLKSTQKHSKIVPIKLIFKTEINTWKEYQNLREFIKQFINSSSNESLSNALELKNLIKNIKDSSKPKGLKTSAFNARINILYNESLRLVDMSKIPAIKTDEVNLQVGKILTTFSYVNEKINTVFSQKAFEELVTIDTSYIGLDTTKVDSISKKKILSVEKKVFEEKINSKTFKELSTKKEKIK